MEDKFSESGVVFAMGLKDPHVLYQLDLNGAASIRGEQVAGQGISRGNVAEKGVSTNRT